MQHDPAIRNLDVTSQHARLLTWSDSACPVQSDLASEGGPLEKQREFLWRLADAYDKDGRLAQAERELKILLEMPLSEEQQLEALCFLAEVQVNFSVGWRRPIRRQRLWPS